MAALDSDRIAPARELLMYPAGWFTDPQDPNMLRYYDGQAWTEHQRPVAPPPAALPAPPPPVAPPPASAPQWGYQTPQPEPTVVLPVVAPQPPQAPWQPVATGAWQQPPPQAPGYPPQYPPAGRRRNRPLIFGVLAVIVVAVLVGGYFLFFTGTKAPTITYQGAKIKDAASILKSAEQSLDTVTSKRHGAKSDTTRCYFAIPNTQPSGVKKKKTDIDSNLRCGPVLFVDGDAAKEYLKFALTRSGSGDPVALTAATSPLTDVPVSADDVTLKRPDGKNAPSGAGGLNVPDPPSAAADTIAAADLGSASVPAAPKGAVIGSWSGGITLTNLGPITRYGTGDEARSAPSGQKLIAFKTSAAEGNDGTTLDLTSSATISVDGAGSHAVPDAGSGHYVVAAVPTDAKSVDLVLVDKGLRQSLSLLTGTPAAGNVLVLARRNRETAGTQTAKAVFTFSPTVVFGDGVTGASEAATVTFRLAELSYRNTDQSKAVTASNPRQAIMHVAMTYVAVHDSGSFGFPPGLLTFTPTGGAPIHARNISTTAGRIYNVLEVPGNVTTGTLTVSGAVNQTFRGSTGSYRFGIQTPVRIRISIPAG